MVNVVDSGVILSSGDLTIQGAGNSSTARSGIAAIQIVEVEAMEYEATISGVASSLEELEWTPAKPETGFRPEAVLRVSADAPATLTANCLDETYAQVSLVLDENITLKTTGLTVGALAVSSPDSALKLDFTGISGEDLAKNTACGVRFYRKLIWGALRNAVEAALPALPMGYTGALAPYSASDGVLRFVVGAPSAAQFKALSVNVSRNSDNNELGDTVSYGLYPVGKTDWRVLTNSGDVIVATDYDGVTIAPTIENLKVDGADMGDGLFDGAVNDNPNVDEATAEYGFTLSGLNANIGEKYRVIVYLSTNQGSGYSPVEIGGTLYWGPGAGEGLTVSAPFAVNNCWGSTAARSTAIEGANAVVSDVLTADSVTVKTCRKYSAYGARAGICALQVVKVGELAENSPILITKANETISMGDATNWAVDEVPESGAIEIAVAENATVSLSGTYSFDSIELTGSGTLSFAGEGVINVGSVTIGKNIRLNEMGKLQLAETAAYSGALFNSGETIGYGRMQTWKIVLSDDALVRVDQNHDFGLIANGYNATTPQLNGHTLTKCGDGQFMICNTSTPQNDSGELHIAAGCLWTVNNPSSLTGITLSVDAGAQLQLTETLNACAKLQFNGGNTPVDFVAAADKWSCPTEVNAALFDATGVAVGTEVTFVRNSSNGLIADETAKVEDCLGSRWDAAVVTADAVKATVSTPTKFFHYDFNGTAATVDKVADARYQINSWGDVESAGTCIVKSGKTGSSAHIYYTSAGDRFVPHWGANSADQAPNYAGAVTVVTVAKLMCAGDSEHRNPVAVPVWGLGSSLNSNEGVGLVALDVSTVAVIRWKGSVSKVLAQVGNIPDLTKKFHFFAVVADGTGTKLYVDRLSAVVGGTIPTTIGQSGQFGRKSVVMRLLSLSVKRFQYS